MRSHITKAPHLDEDSREVQPPVCQDALLRLQIPQPLLEQRGIHRVPALRVAGRQT
jgi:hypothetical protein